MIPYPKKPNYRLDVFGLLLFGVADDYSLPYQKTGNNVLPWLGFCSTWAGVGSGRLKSFDLGIILCYPVGA